MKLKKKIFPGWITLNFYCNIHMWGSEFVIKPAGDMTVPTFFFYV